MQKDLEKITVTSLEQAVAAPYATAKLADAGARVLKIERPGTGDFARHYDNYLEGHSIHFVWLNRGKESVCLDLKDADDQDLLRQIILSSDVFVQNLKPGALAKVGLDSASMRQRNKRLITCDISGFGDSGPSAHLKAYDLIVQAESGLCSITGTPNGPARVGVSICDISAGMTAHGAIMQALFARAHSGEGRAIKVSLFDSIADWMNVPMLQSLYGDRPVKRAGVTHPSIAPYGAFACRDGKKVIISVQNEREWEALCAHFLGDLSIAVDDRFHDNPTRVVNRAALDHLLDVKFAQLSVSEATKKLERIGIAYGQMRELEDAAHHPHLRFVDVGTPDGKSVRVVAPGAILSDDVDDQHAYPALGQHTELVKREFAKAGVQA